MIKILKYVLVDILRTKTILAYTLLLLLLSIGIFQTEDNAQKGIITLLHTVLFIVPLVSIIFTTTYLYNSSEFIELLVSQPLKRSRIWVCIFSGLCLALGLAFSLGVGLPILLFAYSISGIILLTCGVLLSFVFVAIAMWTTVRIRDKAKGIGFAILLWLYFGLIFDALVLFLLFQFADYPIEKGLVITAMLNPIDLARILLLLQVDISALMGYTGAIFRNFFGSTVGISITAVVLILWIVIPFVSSLLYFKKKDL